MFRLLPLLALLLTLALPASAATRQALVIGNDTYAHVTPLEKARGDARAVSAQLEVLGFEVATVLDATRRDMNRAIAQFTGKLQPGDTALVFYAGHGVEIDGENYLLPVDIEAADATAEDFVKFESVALSDLMYRVQSTGARTTLMFLDACRDNPFAATNGRSIGGSRGLARIAAPEGSFVVFSAGARQQALDRLDDGDEDENSVFTRLLLPKLAQPGLELRDLISELRVEVRDLALTRDHAQFPAYYDELLGDFYFTAASAPPPAPTPAPETAAPTSDMRADFELARSIGTVEAWQAFLDTYGAQDALPVRLAQDELENLRGLTLAPGPEPEPEQEQPKDTDDAPARHLTDERARIRATQAALNGRGCNAGGADGIIGARTRAAFAAFIDASGRDLRPSDLGSQLALDVIEATQGRVCRASVAAAPAPDQPSASTPASLAGTWSFTAKCPLFITVTGTLTLRQTGPNTYAASKHDSLGQSSTGVERESNGALSGRHSWNTGVTETTNSRLTANRRQLSGSSSTGCTYTARKTG